METDNLLKEDHSDGRGGVGVAQCDEVCVFREVIDHHQDYRFLARLQESLDEINGYVLPYRDGDVELLEEASRV
jgi:hypothetical protein